MAYPTNTTAKVQRPDSTDSKPMGSSSSSSSHGSRRGSGGRGLVSLIILVLILAGGFYFISNSSGFGSNPVLTLNAEWQAVFLTNGQIYFGKIVATDDNFTTLENIYYLQVVTQPLQRSAEGELPDANAQPEQRLTLIKLGNEIHGPRDRMIINNDQIVLIEDLKSNSRVVQAISDYVSNQAAQ